MIAPGAERFKLIARHRRKYHCVVPGLLMRRLFRNSGGSMLKNRQKNQFYCAKKRRAGGR
jgi:hypothetical protein